MATLSIFLILVFAVVLCYVEIPDMRKKKLIKELWTFFLILITGVTLLILKSLNIKIPISSDFIAWVYSPVKEIMKRLTK